MAVLLATAAACGGEGEVAEAGWAGEIVDSAGIALVRNAGGGIWGGEAGYALTEEVRIGGLEAEDVYQFGLVVGIDVDAEGRMYVADQQAQLVRVYGADGSWVRDIGRPGAGPGELGLGIAGIFVNSEGVHVPDMGNFRMSSFSWEGESTGTMAFDLTAGIPIRWDQHPDGRVAAQVRPSAPGPDGNPLGDVVRTMEEEPEVILELPVGESFQLSSDGIPQWKLFEAEPVWDLGEDGRLAFGVNSDYRFQLLDQDGKVTRVVSMPFEERPVTEMDRQLVTRAFGKVLGDQGLPPALVDQFTAGISFGDFYPPFLQIVLAADGAIWVQHIRTAAELGESEELDFQDLGSDRWDVFDPEGRFLGAITMPTRFQPFSFQGDVVYGVQRDELDVQSIVRYRLTSTDSPTS